MTQLSPRVLVLDDEPEMRKALQRLLRSYGFRVETHGRGEDLLASLQAGLPDCIVLDLHMPGISGFDVLATLKSDRIRTPVVVITGHDEPSTEQRVRSSGVVAYFTKPVDESALISAIEQAVSSSPTREPERREKA